jgi:tetratricopeptide (TPR) repeat protein
MTKRYFNWKLAIVLLISITVLAVTAFVLRQWHRSSRAEQGLVLGNKAYNEHRWEEATLQLGRYIAIYQNDVKVLLKYANAQLNIRPAKSSNIKQAMGSYRIALRVDPNNSEAANQLTGLYLAIGAPGEAELIAKRHLEKNQDPELGRLLALSLARQRKFDEAASQLKIIITEHPEQVLAYETLGQLTEQRQKDFPGEPERWFNEAVKNNPSSALAYVIRAGFYLRSKDETKALADLEHAEKLNLAGPVVQLRLAQEFANAGVLSRAEEHLIAAQRAESTNQAVWQIWAQLALKSQSQAKMLQVAETGLKELSSQPWDFMSTAAELFIRAGQFDRATDCINQLRQKDITPSLTAFLEGLLADRKGQGYEAVRCWQRAMGLGNKSPQIRLMLALTLSGLGDSQSAIWQLRKFVSEQPNSFEGHLALTKLLAQTTNFTEAVEHASMAVKLSPSNTEAVFLNLQTRLQLLAARSKDESQMRQEISNKDLREFSDINNQLAWLEKATNGALGVKLLHSQLALQQDDFADAEAVVAELRESHPAEIEVNMAEVDLLMAQNKKDAAITILQKTIEKFPQADRPVKYLAILSAQQGDYGVCETIINDALTRIEQPVVQRELGLLLADLYTIWKKENKTYKFLSALTQKLPSDIPIKRRLLRCEEVIKDPLQAEQIVSDIKSLEGQDGWQWRYEQAKLWFEAENFKDRYPQILTLLKVNLLAYPDDQSNRILLAATYERGGDMQLAISTYSEALTRSPRDIRIIAPLVAVLYKANEYDRADEILRQADSEKLVNPELKKLELQSHLRRGELDSASDILQTMLTNEPNNRSICLSLALLQMRQNKFAEAGELLNKMKIQEPNSMPVVMAQIEFNIRQGKSDEALLLCDQVVNQYHSVSAYILRGRTYAMLGHNEKATENFEYATVIEPNSIEAWVVRSDFYRSLGQTDKAIDAIQKALSLAPHNIQIQKRTISLLLPSGNSDKVRQGKTLLDEALQANPEDGELQLFRVRSLLAVGTAQAIEQAKNILQTVTQDSPEIGDAWLLLGELSLEQGHSGEAMDIALRGLVYRNNDKALLALKARAEAARAPELAIPTLKLLRELDPNDVDMTVLLSNTYVAAGEPKSAIELLEKQIASCKTDADTRKIRIALSVAMYKNGDKARSQEIFDSLYKLNPDDPSVLLAEARLLKDDKLWSQIIQKTKHWYEKHQQDTVTPITIARDLALIKDSRAKDAAEDILRTILASDSGCIDAMKTLGMLLHTAGRSAEAVILYQRILKVQPDNLIVINNLAWIMCEEHGRYQQALELTQSGLEKTPDYVDLIDTRGVIYYRLGEFNKAVQDFTRCIELYPAEVPSVVASYYHLGRALVGLGQVDKAVESLKKVLELNAKIGGLSDADVAEVHRLLKNLQSQGVSKQ